MVGTRTHDEGAMGEDVATRPTWPAVTYESLPWRSSHEELALVSKRARRRVASTFRAAVPAQIADASLALPPELAERISALESDLARFDTRQEARGYDLPALLLRSESAASSQIESLTSSVRNVAWAELSDRAPHNARLIAGNVAAMRTALALPDELTIEGIQDIHRSLMAPTGELFGGNLRDEQVWVGGTGVSPHGALFVPPQPARVRACLDDLVTFSRRDDLNPLAKAAVLHAQFETIHPFIDGNGRTGRTLLHKVLRRDGVLETSALPVSAGLLHDIDAYMAAIRRYQAGDPLPMVERVVDALASALLIGSLVATAVDGVLTGWRASLTARRGSSILRLPDVLVEQPVVSSAFLAQRLDITVRAANDVLNKACDLGILRPIGDARRGVFYQADALIAILEEVSGAPEIRRVLARGSL